METCFVNALGPGSCESADRGKLAIQAIRCSIEKQKRGESGHGKLCTARMLPRPSPAKCDGIRLPNQPEGNLKLGRGQAGFPEFVS